MHCVKRISEDLTWVGANDRRLGKFEGVYAVPRGVSYNSYLLTDEKTVLFNTADNAVRQRFLENIAFALGDRKLDYIIVQHVEPDHSSVLEEVMRVYPEAKVVCNERTLNFLEQFFVFDIRSRTNVVTEKDTLSTGRHNLHFAMAPMVHWPEVMVVYDEADKTLFSADAFGSFGALCGAVYADEVDFDMNEARRYYANIVGKYGTQVSALFKKLTGLKVEKILPLHGFAWRDGGNINEILTKYSQWSSYEPEEQGVLIAYASVYGNTANAAEILACKLHENGIKTAMFDVSVTSPSDIVSEAFRWSHIVIASTTYNAGIFVAMEAVVHDLASHNLQNRTVAIIENGSWAATSGGLIRCRLSECKNINFLDAGLSIRSSLKSSQLSELDAMVEAIADSFPKAAPQAAAGAQSDLPGSVDVATMFKLSYGLFVLTAKDGSKDNGCIINTVTQITSTPNRISIAVNKANFTHDMILKTGEFNVSILSEGAPFHVFQQFGFQSGKDTDKFAESAYDDRAANGIRYVPLYTNGMISGKVAESYDYGTHTLFVADVTQAIVLSGEKSVTYQYYFDNIKPKPQPKKESQPGYVCKICAYVYEGDVLPDDFICQLCKHGAADFEKN